MGALTVRSTDAAGNPLYSNNSFTEVPLAADAQGRLRTANGNSAATALTLAAASASVSGADQLNESARGAQVVVDITAITGTGASLTVVIEGKDPASGKYYTLLQSAALTAVGTTVLNVYPGLTAAANVTASAILPRTWRVRAVIAGTTPAVTATVGASLVI